MTADWKGSGLVDSYSPDADWQLVDKWVAASRMGGDRHGLRRGAARNMCPDKGWPEEMRIAGAEPRCRLRTERRSNTICRSSAAILTFFRAARRGISPPCATYWCSPVGLLPDKIWLWWAG